MRLSFRDSTFAEQLLCHKRHVDPPAQKRAANRRFPSCDWDFSAVAAKYSIQLFRFNFDGDWFTFGGLCEREFEDAVLQDSRRFGRLDFGWQPQFAAELVRAELGEQSLLLLFLRRLLRLAADNQPLRLDADFDFVGGEAGDLSAHSDLTVSLLDLDRHAAH